MSATTSARRPTISRSSAHAGARPVRPRAAVACGRGTCWRPRRSVLASLMAIPAIRETVLERLHLLPIPAEKRIAVLPVQCPGATAAQQAACDGLLDSVVTRLGALQASRQNVELRARHRRPAGRRDGGQRRPAPARAPRWPSTSACSARAPRTVVAAQPDGQPGASGNCERRARQFETLQASLLDETVEAVVGMLEIELKPDGADEPCSPGPPGSPRRRGSTSKRWASRPYQQAQSALERADQQQSLEKAIGLLQQGAGTRPRLRSRPRRPRQGVPRPLPAPEAPAGRRAWRRSTAAARSTSTTCRRRPG